MISFELMQTEISDAVTVMEWRNDPITLKNSLTYRTPKTIEQFYPEFLLSYFSLADLPSVFAVKGGERIAAIRFDSAENPKNLFRKCAEISINVAPKWRSKGLGAEILKQIKKWALQQGYDALLAKIKKGNAPSISVFSKAGFEFIKEMHLEIDNKKEPLLIFLTELTPLKEEKIFIIAEAGSNWRVGNFEQDLERSYALIEAAKEASADAVKFQLFRSETVYVKNAGMSDYLREGGIRKEIGELFKEMEMPYEMIPLLAKRCSEVGIQFLVSTFSVQDFDQIDPFVSMHKIASYEISHLHLLERAAKSGKPLLLSTGASTVSDIDWAVKTFKKYSGKDLTLLQATAKYPATAHGMHLNTIPWLKKRYGVRVGLSDHSLDPLTAPLAAVALGAKVIEKHFTLSKQLHGPDHAFALEPIELKKMVKGIREVQKMLGSAFKKVYEEERELYDFARRRVQALKDIQTGEILEEGKNIAILRPGKRLPGLHPKYLEAMEGKPAKNFIAAGDGIKDGDF